MRPFDLEPRTRLVFGAGCAARVGELARELGARRALLVTAPGIVEAGHAGRAEEALAAAGIATRRFGEVREDPTTDDVDACLAAARDFGPDLFVAVGGGSSIDTAKGANFLLTNGGAMEDYWGSGKAARPMLPLIAVPTTAGTGSEVQSYALIERASDHRKMACGDPQAAPRVAVLDPELTASMPRRVAAFTGLDALTHAVEAAVTRKRNAVSALFSGEAFRLGIRALPAVLAGDADVAMRGDMLLAAAFAGLAIESSMLGAAHSMANPLTARYDLHHGQAVGLVLPHVVRFNAADAGAASVYARLAVSAGLCAGEASGVEAVEALIVRLADLLALAEVGTLAAAGVEESALDELAGEAAQQWTAGFNPRAVTAADFRTLYGAALAAG